MAWGQATLPRCRGCGTVTQSLGAWEWGQMENTCISRASATMANQAHSGSSRPLPRPLFLPQFLSDERIFWASLFSDCDQDSISIYFVIHRGGIDPTKIMPLIWQCLSIKVTNAQALDISPRRRPLALMQSHVHTVKGTGGHQKEPIRSSVGDRCNA
jgi:hypothetical protein